MNIVRVKPVESWKSTAGLCIICGIPLGLNPSNKLSKEGFDQDYDDTMFKKTLLSEKEEDGAENSLELDENTLEENFIRVSLFKYNLLGKMDACHIIDQYTFLKTKESASFKKALLENRALIEAMGGNLIEDAFKDGAFEKAVDYCQRVAAKRVVPGCKVCNSTMNRANTHADIVYRCFEPTAKLHIPELEDSTTKTGRVISKGILVKKLIQQIALYYQIDTNKEGQKIWRPRDEAEIMPQAAVWRCVANLAMWGKNGAVRFALVAVFYAAVYIYERLKMSDLMGFTDWHLHVFRIYYMSAYPAATWFGMTQQEAGVKFDTTRKEGLKWCDEVTGKYMDYACEGFENFFRSKVSQTKINHFKSILLMRVHDEKTLFIYLCKKCGAKEGINTLMNFFMYNFENPRAILLLARAQAFMKEIKRPITKELLTLLHEKKEGDTQFKAVSWTHPEDDEEGFTHL